MIHEEINASFHRKLKLDELTSLIESGIKFFLFQRGQIPIPYDKLHTLNSKSETSDFSSSQQNSQERKEEDNELNYLESGIQRLLKIKSQRKISQKQMLLERKNKKLQEKEICAHALWEDLFLRLRLIFQSSYASQIQGVALIFGSSIYHHKEIITFRIDPELIESLTTEKENEANVTDFNSIVRSFCKSIIMSSEFLSFTEKNLRTTCSQICIISSQLIHQSNKDTELILIENSHAIFSNTFSGQGLQRKNQKKSLRVNMQLKDFDSKTNISDSSLFDESDLSLANLNESDDEVSYFYQFPFKFKGIFVKSKPLL